MGLDVYFFFILFILQVDIDIQGNKMLGSNATGSCALKTIFVISEKQTRDLKSFSIINIKLHLERNCKENSINYK